VAAIKVLPDKGPDFIQIIDAAHVPDVVFDGNQESFLLNLAVNKIFIPSVTLIQI
jgi:hypothetical protein